MFYFNGIIVVEGKTDVAFLSSFIMSEYVITNGYELPKSEIAYLEAASKIKQVLVITDPDEPGKQFEQDLKFLILLTFLQKRFSAVKRKNMELLNVKKTKLLEF